MSRGWNCPGSSESRARDGLRHAVAALRGALPDTKPPILLVEGPTLALNPAAVDVDVATFERMVADGTPEALEQAAALYQGDLLSGFSLNEPLFEEWLVPERERLRELALETLAKLLAHQGKSGPIERAVQTAVRLVGLDPLQEVVHRALMRLFVRQGRRGAALKQYQLCVAAQRELGTDPEVETKQLYQQILRRQPLGPLQAPDAARSRAPHRTGPAPLDLPGPDRPLIGREPELARLRRLLDEVERGHGQLVAIAGEAGIGKTSLLGAVAADATSRGAHVLLGRCYESASILAFGPWVDAFRGGQILDDAELVDELNPVWRSELARLLPELGRAGLPAPSDDQLRLFESVAHLVERLAARQPLVLLLEDIHWADDMSLRLLAFISRRSPRWHVLLLTTAREEEIADAPTARRTLEELGRGPHAAILKLVPLSRPDTALLVRSLSRVGSDAQTLTRLEGQVWSVSEGNPFVAVETIRALQEGSILEGPARLPLARRVHELIAGRLERLSDRARRLAAVGAVIGEEFDFLLLQRGAGLGEEPTAEGVEELVRGRVLHGSGERLDFVHDRIRAVVYSQLLPSDRKRLHRRVGEALEALSASNLEPHHLALGVHFREGDVWDKAVTFLRLAGTGATARSASRQAIACFEGALNALAHLAESAETIRLAVDLRLDLQSGHVLIGDLPRMLDYLHEAEALATRLGDWRRLVRVSCHMANCFWWTGQLESAIGYSRRALVIASNFPDSSLQILARGRLGLAYMALGEYRQAIETIEENLKALSGDLAGDRFEMAALPTVSGRVYLANCLATLGEFTAAAAAAAGAVEIALRVDHPYSVALAYFGAGRWRTIQGNFGEAIPWLERGLDYCRREGVYAFSFFAAWTGIAYAHSGRLPEAISLLEQAGEQEEALRFMVYRPSTLAFLAQAWLLAGRQDDARRQSREALDLSLARKQRAFEADALRVLAEIHALHDPPEEAQAVNCFDRALAAGEERGMRPLVARCHLGLGKLYRSTGKPAEARRELTIAADMLRSMKMAFWLEQAEAEFHGLTQVDVATRS